MLCIRHNNNIHSMSAVYHVYAYWYRYCGMRMQCIYNNNMFRIRYCSNLNSCGRQAWCYCSIYERFSWEPYEEWSLEDIGAERHRLFRPLLSGILINRHIYVKWIVRIVFSYWKCGIINIISRRNWLTLDFQSNGNFLLWYWNRNSSVFVSHVPS